MPIPRLSNTGPTLSHTAITHAEAQLGFKFPDEYLDFLRKHNGGIPEPPYFGMTGDAGSELDVFYSIGASDPTCDVVKMTAAMRGKAIPAELMPIGCDAGGNRVCLGVTGKQCGKVFFLDHEEPGIKDGKPTYDNAGVIADSFNAFLESFDTLS